MSLVFTDLVSKLARSSMSVSTIWQSPRVLGITRLILSPCLFLSALIRSIIWSISYGQLISRPALSRAILIAIRSENFIIPLATAYLDMRFSPMATAWPCLSL